MLFRGNTGVCGDFLSFSSSGLTPFAAHPVNFPLREEEKKRATHSLGPMCPPRKWGCVYVIYDFHSVSHHEIPPTASMFFFFFCQACRIVLGSTSDSLTGYARGNAMGPLL